MIGGNRMANYNMAAQNKLKPQIEEIIPEYLTGDNQKRALEFQKFILSVIKIFPTSKSQTAIFHFHVLANGFFA